MEKQHAISYLLSLREELINIRIDNIQKLNKRQRMEILKPIIEQRENIAKMIINLLK